MKWIICALLLLSLGGRVLARQELQEVDDCNGEISFKYLIASNSVSKEKGLKTGSREIWIFLDPRAFSEKNLKLLFLHLGKKYSNSAKLYIWVETNWDTIPTSDSDCEGSAQSGETNRPNSEDYYKAIYFRTGEVELFRYNPILRSTVLKTVVLRGKDIGDGL